MTTGYTIRTTVNRPYEQTVEAVRTQLDEAGFGILTEIDSKATLKKKLDVDVAAQVILGACRPELAHRALEIESSIAALLPCNVVVRRRRRDHHGRRGLRSRRDDVPRRGGRAGDALSDVAADARERLNAALAVVDTATKEGN